MNSRYKRGFTLIECLISLIILTWMLSFYLPAYYLQQQKIKVHQVETQEWHLFYQLARIHLSKSPNKKEALIQRIESYQLTHPVTMTDFACNEKVCYINFSNGDHYEIELLEAI